MESLLKVIDQPHGLDNFISAYMLLAAAGLLAVFILALVAVAIRAVVNRLRGKKTVRRKKKISYSISKGGTLC